MARLRDGIRPVEPVERRGRGTMHPPDGLDVPRIERAVFALHERGILGAPTCARDRESPASAHSAHADEARSRLDGMGEVPSQSRLRNAEPRRGREQ